MRFIPQAYTYDEKPTIKELVDSIFGKSDYAHDDKPIEKKNFGESLNTFEKEKEKDSSNQ